MLSDAAGQIETLEALKGLGVRLVLDDFGTGYASLGYLTRLPLDTLKVDRSFVDGLGTEGRDTAITEAIIAMSRALSLEVVGEGVETRAAGRRADAAGVRSRAGLLLLPAGPARARSQACSRARPDGCARRGPDPATA